MGVVISTLQNAGVWARVQTHKIQGFLSYKN